MIFLILHMSLPIQMILQTPVVALLVLLWGVGAHVAVMHITMIYQIALHIEITINAGIVVLKATIHVCVEDRCIVARLYICNVLRHCQLMQSYYLSGLKMCSFYIKSSSA